MLHRLAAGADQVAAGLCVAELARDAERLRIALDRTRGGARAPRPSNASCSTPARISVPRPWPCQSRPSQEPVSTVRSSANLFPRSACTPTGCPSAKATRFSTQASGRQRPRLETWCSTNPFSKPGSPAASVHASSNGIRSGSWMPACATRASDRSSAAVASRSSSLGVRTRSLVSGDGGRRKRTRSSTTSKPSFA